MPAQPSGAGASLRDKTRWHFAGTEHLVGLMAHFWDSAGGCPKGVKLGMGASERISTQSPQELLLWKEEEVPEWEEGSAALVLGCASSSALQSGANLAAQEPLRTRQRRPWIWPCTGSQASASPSTVMMPVAARGSRRKARTGT